VKRHDLPNGRSVFFDPEPHVYYDEAGSEFYGVTTVIKDIGGGPPAKYYEKNAIQGFFDLKKRRPDWAWDDVDAEDVLRWLEMEGLDSGAIFRNAGTTGTAVHKVFEALPSGDIPSDIPEVEADRVARLVQWWNENVEETYHSEIVVASHSQGYAGTVDWVGRIKGQNGVGIIDLKTSNYVQPKYHFQLDGYREAYMESGYGETQWQAVLHLPKDKPLRFVPGKAAPGAFRAQLDSFKHQKHISPPRRKPAPNLPLAA
jgi:hypothetical protein